MIIRKLIGIITFSLLLNTIVASEFNFSNRVYQKIGTAASFSASFLATCVATHTFIHNIGHGLTLKYLVNNKKNIIFTDLIDGNVSYPKNSLSKKEEIIYYLAGPALELCINYAYYKLMEKVSDKHAIFNGFKCGAMIGMTEAAISLVPLKLYVPTAQHAIKSDGYYILKNLDSKNWFLRKYLRSFKS